MTNLAFDMTPERDEPAPRPADARPIPRITIQAFCDTPEIAGTIETAAADRRMSRAHVKVHTGGLDRGRRVLPLGADAEPDPGRDAGCPSTSSSARSTASPRSATPAPRSW